MSTSQEQFVLAIESLERDAAYSAAAALSELIEPAADAVSIFEDGPHWRIDAYYTGSETAETALTRLSSIYAEQASKASLKPVVQVTAWSIGEVTLTIRLSCTWRSRLQPTPQKEHTVRVTV